MAGTIELLSVDQDGAAGNDSSENAAINVDGRIVAFASNATNLVPDDDNDLGDIFVRDRNSGVTELVSVGYEGEPADADSYRPSISADGSLVAFESDAANLVALDGNESGDIFVRDRNSDVTIRVSVDSAGNEGNGYSSGAAISGNGQFVAFASSSTNLVDNDENDATDIFVRDLVSGTTERLSVSTGGEEGNAGSSSLGSPPSISADGRFVAFESSAANLVDDDTNDSDDIFVHDRESGTTDRVSVDADGNEVFGTSYNPAISADGRFVAFVSTSSSLVPDDDNLSTDIFVKELATGAIERVSVSATGVEGNGGSFAPAISADGRFVAFASSASNLVPGDSNEETDLFVVDREAGTIARISVGTEGQQANNGSFAPALNADGDLAAFHSFASNFGFDDFNGTGDVFLATTAFVPPAPETVIGTDGNDQIRPGKVSKGVIGLPTDADDVIDARGGADQVRAGSGNDIIYGDGETFQGGAAGKDKLFGDAGDDHLYGDFGGDLGSSPGGDDQLTGGPGADTFHLGRGKDTVTDFVQGEDVLDLGQLFLTFADLDSDGDETLTGADDFVTVRGKSVLLDLGAAAGGPAGVDVSSIVVGRGIELVASDFEAIA
jgi:Tol biopolymer transport system component